MACMEGGDDEHLMTKLRKSRLTVSDDFGFVPSLCLCYLTWLLVHMSSDRYTH